MDVMVSFLQQYFNVFYTVRYQHDNYNNIFLAPRVSTWVRHLQVTVKRNGVLVVYCIT
jgi:hypothetical protein